MGHFLYTRIVFLSQDYRKNICMKVSSKFAVGNSSQTPLGGRGQKTPNLQQSQWESVSSRDNLLETGLLRTLVLHLYSLPRSYWLTLLLCPSLIGVPASDVSMSGVCVVEAGLSQGKSACLTCSHRLVWAPVVSGGWPQFPLHKLSWSK